MNEQWKIIHDHPLYEVSNLGRVRRTTYLKPYVDSNGYLTVKFWEKNRCAGLRRLHRLVAQAFVPNAVPKWRDRVNHMDGNKLNCGAENLEWVTDAENTHHAHRTGLIKNYARGERTSRAKLSEPQIRCIRKFQGLGWRGRSMARHFGVTQNTISGVALRKVWKHL